MSEPTNPYRSPQSDASADEPVVPRTADRHAVMCHVTEDDLLAWARHFMQHTNVLKKQRRMVALSLACLLLGSVLLLGTVTGEWLVTFVLLCPLFVIVGTGILLLPLIQRRSTARLHRQLYRQGNLRNSIGDVRYEITPDELRRETRYGRSVNYWQGIEGIELGEEHLFIIIAPGSAYLVPYRDFNDEQHRTNFLTACQDWFEQGQEREMPLPSWA